MTFTRKTYEKLIHLFLKDPPNCDRGKEYRLAKFMLNMIPNLSFWESVKTEKVFSLTFFLTKENKALFKEDYSRYLKMLNFNPDALKNDEVALKDKKIGEDLGIKPRKKMNKLDFTKNGSKKEN